MTILYEIREAGDKFGIIADGYDRQEVIDIAIDYMIARQCPDCPNEEGDFELIITDADGNETIEELCLEWSVSKERPDIEEHGTWRI